MPTSKCIFFLLHDSYGVLENVDKAQTKVRAKNENVAGNVLIYHRGQHAFKETLFLIDNYL